MPGPDEPIFSVVVAIVSDTINPPDASHLDQCLGALRRQTGTPPLEIIVPYHPSVKGIGAVRDRFPDVRFEEVADLKRRTASGVGREHHDELRARGLMLARGRIVALIEDHGVAVPEWSSQLIEMHKGVFAAVGGAIENEVDRPLNWAVYFCDFLRYQNPLPAGEAITVSDANVSYKRDALESVSPAWSAAFQESAVNAGLRAAGKKLALAPAAVVNQHRLGLELWTAMKERYVWGRSYAAMRGNLAGTPRRLVWAALVPALPLLILARMTLMAYRKRRTFAVFVRAFPYTALLIVGWSWGELTGYLSGTVNSESRPAENAASASRSAS
jgi:hypothetical protein